MEYCFVVVVFANRNPIAISKPSNGFTIDGIYGYMLVVVLRGQHPDTKPLPGRGINI